MSPTAPLILLVLAVVAAGAASAMVPASAASAVAVDGGTAFQRIDGFGISEAFGQANSIRNASGATQRQALDMLFSTINGAGVSILRSIIPSGSDSIEPRSPGRPSATPADVWN